ncbi:MAG: helix-turn-helix transcriptional regulator [Armatimonadota bacterium]
MESFGILLKKLRGKMAASELAKRLHVPRSYIANLEAGRKVPTAKQARRILERGLGLNVTDAARCLMHVLLFDYGVRDEQVREGLLELIDQAKAKKRPAGFLQGQLEEPARRLRHDKQPRPTESRPDDP